MFTFIVTYGEPARAQELSNATPQATQVDYGALVGRWVRPDGGYTVTITGVKADGQLEASYSNPDSLPFSKAKATSDGDEMEVFLELVAGGYNGSTYTLSYDPADDVLRGVYYQANARVNYDIYFERAE